MNHAAKKQTADPVLPDAARVPMQEAAIDIWDQKYRLKTKEDQAVDENIDATRMRVASVLADVEIDTNPDLDATDREQVIENFRWAMEYGAIPAGRIISNAGAQAHKPATSTINCTVSDTVHDSMEAILDRVKDAGLTLKSGAGIGYDFSTLRHRGAFVDGAGASTSGPLSFMDIFDRTCFTVSSAGGRRGAQMATFDVGHPDVMDFIRAKREDGRLRQFNLSLLITEDFLEAVRNDTDWPLAFPVRRKELEGIPDSAVNDGTQYIYRDWPETDEDYVKGSDGRTLCRIARTVSARNLWNLIMTSTYDYAEPGFILIDRVNEMNNNWFCEHIRASNPCVTADTWVHTNKGPRQVSDLLHTAFVARIDGADHAAPEGFFKTGDKDVLRVTLKNGMQLRLTDNHRVRVATNGRRGLGEVWKEAGDLVAGESIVVSDHRRGSVAWDGAGDADEGYLLGLLKGDGTLHDNMGAILSTWQPRVAVAGEHATASGASGIERAVTHAIGNSIELGATHQGWANVEGRSERRLHSRGLARLAASYGLSKDNGKSVTPLIESTSSDFHAGFLRGLFDADGSVQGSTTKGVSVRLAQSDKTTLRACQRMLARLGINSSLHLDRRATGDRTLPDGRGGHSTYACRADHELIISCDNLAQFRDVVGFNDTDKQTALVNALNGYKRALNKDGFASQVAAIEHDGTEPVFDVQVPGINAFDANGLVVHNCGEQMLPPNGSCLLGSVNLTLFVDKPFTDEAAFDWKRFREVVRVFTRMLDNVVEVNGLPLDAQQREIEYKRRHGMGYLGLGSTLAMLGVPYGSDDAVAMTETITRELAVEGWREGLNLARNKRPAPIMDDTFTVTPTMLRIRPEMRADGYSEGDEVPGRVLLARYSRYMQKIREIDPDLVDAIAEQGARFTHHTSIAPTGTIALSLANNASNGIEPSFAHQYQRNIIREGKKTKEAVDVFSFELLAYRHLVDAEATAGSDLPKGMITADDVTPKQHVRMQAAAQNWVDSSISKTVNVPTEIPFEDFKGLYMDAADMGLKGCTTFRFNPEVFSGVLTRTEDLENTIYTFELEDGSKMELRGNEEVEYDGEIHTASNLFDALKENTFGKW